MVLTFEVYVRWCGFDYVELGCLIIVGYWLWVEVGASLAVSFTVLVGFGWCTVCGVCCGLL